MQSTAEIEQKDTEATSEVAAAYSYLTAIESEGRNGSVKLHELKERDENEAVEYYHSDSAMCTSFGVCNDREGRIVREVHTEDSLPQEFHDMVRAVLAQPVENFNPTNFPFHAISQLERNGNFFNAHRLDQYKNFTSVNTSTGEERPEPDWTCVRIDGSINIIDSFTLIVPDGTPWTLLCGPNSIASGVGSCFFRCRLYQILGMRVTFEFPGLVNRKDIEILAEGVCFRHSDCLRIVEMRRTKTVLQTFGRCVFTIRCGNYEKSMRPFCDNARSMVIMRSMKGEGSSNPFE